ncbi:hypothetical protein NGM99_10110 [Mesorhizobium sp. RP14(2022)]|uniref:Resolvase HTH domain-containing protein n=1 Tax=Mesorhizobium liriopis TaxID=2953882 RepID=A0ABT1C5P4_9HYPH|nr:hypothetical protein [Mesorhizobium liriopis]MCO6050145.1 hypothetical protein [Mesorhizobium liriopis]
MNNQSKKTLGQKPKGASSQHRSGRPKSVARGYYRTSRFSTEFDLPQLDDIDKEVDRALEEERRIDIQALQALWLKEIDSLSDGTTQEYFDEESLRLRAFQRLFNRGVSVARIACVIGVSRRTAYRICDRHRGQFCDWETVQDPKTEIGKRFSEFQALYAETLRITDRTDISFHERAEAMELLLFIKRKEIKFLIAVGALGKLTPSSKRV